MMMRCTNPHLLCFAVYTHKVRMDCVADEHVTASE